jgi:hypothetical protein
MFLSCFHRALKKHAQEQQCETIDDQDKKPRRMLNDEVRDGVVKERRQDIAQSVFEMCQLPVHYAPRLVR